MSRTALPPRMENGDAARREADPLLRIAEMMARAGVTPLQAAVLLTVHELGDHCTPSAVAHKVGCSTSHLTACRDVFVLRGWMLSHRDGPRAKDRRSVRLRLTRHGKKAVAGMCGSVSIKF